MITIVDIEEAAQRLAPHIIETPLIFSEYLSSKTGAKVAIKAEHQQNTGSFKFRGAVNKTLQLNDLNETTEIIAASSGNHGIATAAAASIRGLPCKVYLPSKASPAKVSAIKAFGADIVAIDSADSGEAEIAARSAADQSSAIYISPYNDFDVVAGQGTIGFELLRELNSAQLNQVDAVVVAVGGGGLISGIATWIKSKSPSTLIIGASPAHDQAMVASIQAGKIYTPEAQPTFSDGTAGGIEPEAITFKICQTLVDRWISITEVEIANAVAAMIDYHHQLVEGAAGVAIAGAVRFAEANPGSSVVAISCGANVSSNTLRTMLETAA
ncbi:MAG: threonine/serine dehydratase [Pseudomonadota bacterium]